MLKVLCIASQKGGTGKTSTVAALATGAAHRGLKTLCIDLDPQGSLSAVIGGDPEAANTYQLLKGQRVKPQEVGENIYIIPASMELAALDMELANKPGRDNYFKNRLEPLKKDFDFVVVDTAPTLGTLLINALTASEGVIIPVQADIFASQSLCQLKTTIDEVKRYCNPDLEVMGVLFTRYSDRTILAKSMLEQTRQLAESLGYHCFGQPIREGVAVKEAQALRTPLIEYAPSSKPCQDYEQVLNEIVEGE